MIPDDSRGVDDDFGVDPAAPAVDPSGPRRQVPPAHHPAVLSPEKYRSTGPQHIMDAACA